MIKMTYQQLYDALQDKYAKKSDVFVKMDTKISQTQGFGDMVDMFAYHKAKGEWETASNNYWGFMSRIKGKSINPNDEVDMSILYL